MKKILFLFFALMFVFMTGVKASTCSDKRILELSSLANNVQVGIEKEIRLEKEYYALDMEETIQDTHPAFYVTIFNLTDDLNVSVYREDTNKTVYASKKDADEDGVLYIDAGYATMVKNFTVKIRSNDSACKNEVLKSVEVTTPMYNVLSQREICQENSEFDMCKEFTTVDYDNVSSAEFSEKINQYVEEKAREEKRENSFFYKFAKFISKYKWILITIVVIVTAAVIVYIINRKKSRLV